MSWILELELDLGFWIGILDLGFGILGRWVLLFFPPVPPLVGYCKFGII